MQLDTTVVSIAAVFFLKKAAVIIAIHGQKNYTEVKLYSLVCTTVILRQ